MIEENKPITSTRLAQGAKVLELELEFVVGFCNNESLEGLFKGLVEGSYEEQLEGSFEGSVKG